MCVCSAPVSGLILYVWFTLPPAGRYLTLQPLYFSKQPVSEWFCVHPNIFSKVDV